MTRKLICILLAIMLTILALPALAAESYDSPLYNVIDFKFFHKPYGIGYGNCPVYTAPSTSAFRCANGKASVDTNADMWVGGYDNASGWLLVRYETSNGGVRVGYIPPNYVRGYKADNGRLKFSCIEQTATTSIKITDNPLNPNTGFATLRPGETYYILGKYTYYGNWWYVECYVDGQIARGFINRDTTAVDNGSGVYSTELGVPSASPYGGERIGEVRVQGNARIVRKNAGANYDMVARVSYPEKYVCYDEKTGSNGRMWYYIYVDGVWGWISEGVSVLMRD